MVHEIQGVFVLRTVRDRVYRPLISLCIDFKPALEQNDQLAFPRGRWTVEEEHTPPNIRAHRCCFKILHHPRQGFVDPKQVVRSEEHTSELQSLRHLVCRLLLEKKTLTPP